ncbi:keratinocyte differentiation factor 1 [Xiphophorus maculatus]|uniref:Keratinocyte differentiation factor 1a n=1 Tax=Xiphophorus maculatus TaxID=8083 RepID=A0A3B5PZD3_XIPMA|nr:keratinocyte differentiation factor 1 [Xiphophorus maculatus]
MPGHSSGAPQTSRHSKHHTSTSQGNHKPSRTIYRESTGLPDLRDLHGEHFREHHNDHPRHSESKNGPSRRYPRNGTARGSETIGFIPGSADSAPASRPSCGSCPSMGWSGCKALLCRMLNCGCCGSRETSLPVNESSTDHPPKLGGEPSNGMALTNPTCGVSMEPGKPTKSARLPTSESFRYQDVRFRGEIVNYPVNPSKRTRPPAKGESHRPISNTSLLSNDCYDLDDPCDSTDVDSLITKKLLELYAFHQIEELAKCTSDSSFFRKTNEISDLIYNIAQNYNLEEQEAECKLVHGVIRISTRKAKKKTSHQLTGQRPNGRNDGTLPDSGNETMTQTFMSSDFPEVKVSEQTPSDELARKMRQYGSRTYSSSTSTAYSPYQHDTGTNSSGAPLLI